MRLSHTQKDVLFVLYVFHMRGSNKPVSSMAVLNMINKDRDKKVADTNFRASCHRLVEHGLLSRYRSSKLRLAWCMTEQGCEKAKSIYENRVKDF